jgi:hypothetical protein
MGIKFAKPTTMLNSGDYEQQSTKVMNGKDVISRKHLLSQLLGDYKLTSEQKQRIKTVEYCDGQKGFSFKEVQTLFSLLNAGKWDGYDYWEVTADWSSLNTDTEENAYSYKSILGKNIEQYGHKYTQAIDSYTENDIHNLYTQF